MRQKINELIKNLPGIKTDVLLANWTTFKIGGPADWFFRAKTTREIIKAVNLARDLKIPYFILGGGSNVLVSDQGFQGLVIKVESKKVKVKNEKIFVESGMLLGKLVKLATQNSLSGLEFVIGIPGTVGGAVRGNAGAGKQNFGDKIGRVRVLNEQGQLEWLHSKDCGFSYRQSRFKKNKEIILAVELNGRHKNQAEILKLIKTNLAKRRNQPREPSAGCIFANPTHHLAGHLIEECGLKGRKIGNAQISDQHANFIINLGRAKAKEVLQLIKLAKEVVKEKFNIELQEEIYLLGFDKILSSSKKEKNYVSISH